MTEQGDFERDNEILSGLSEAQIKEIEHFFELWGNNDPIDAGRIADAERDAAELKDELLGLGIDINEPLIWYVWMHSARYHNFLLEVLLDERKALPDGAQVLDAEVLDYPSLVTFALAPPALRR
jgi:hypothetical protein